MKKNIAVYIIGLLSVTSCQTIVDNVELPEIEVASVVHFRYDAALNEFDCSLTKSNPIFGKRRSEFDVIYDATVLLSSSNGTDTISFDADAEKYIGIPGGNMVEGTTYELEVLLKDGSSMTAKDVYPSAPRNIEVEIDSTVNGFETTYTIQASWDDISGIEEYYVIEYYSIYDFGGDKDTVGSYVGLTSVGDDKSKRINQKFTTFTYNEPGSSFSIENFIVVSGITKAHYQYLQFLARYEPENPFTEPTTVPSNITGGLGMFVLKNSKIIDF